MTEVVDKTEPLDETAHPTIEYIEFCTDGREYLRSGYIWAPAPSVKGMRGFWVRPVTDGRVEPLAVAVVKASRRHRVGGLRTVRGHLRWIEKQGRYVDLGTFYSECHDQSPTGLMTLRGENPPPPPTRIIVPPLDPGIFAALSGEPEPGSVTVGLKQPTTEGGKTP